MVGWLAASVNGRWHPGIGDPDFLGWFTTVAYLAAGGICTWAWRRETAAARSADGRGYVPRFWLMLAIAMALLGVNKQLDLQSWFTQVGKDIAKSEGWYARRRPVQVAFVAAVGVVGMTGVGLVAWWLRGNFRRYRVAVAGLVYVACFVVIRAASFHHIDHLLHVGLEHVRLNHVLELGGIGLIAWGAGRALLRIPVSHPSPGEPGEGGQRGFEGEWIESQ